MEAWSEEEERPKERRRTLYRLEMTNGAREATPEFG